MAEAANLSVSITGDASGLISSVNAARSAIADLNASGAKIMDEFNGKEAKIKLSAVDNTAAGVASARANINSLKDKTVTVSVRYSVSGMPRLAHGTKNAREGLAVINDEKGARDPRELVESRGRLMMFSGRDVIVPLAKGDKVYTSEETRAIMSGLGLPHYASGKNNADFEAKKSDFTHYKRTNNVSAGEELSWWNGLLEQFMYDGEAVKEIQEEIFSAQQKINKELKQSNEKALADYKKSSDAWIKYQTEVNDMSVAEQIASYKRQIENYNGMVSQMVASTEYSSEELKEIWDDFYSYKSGVDLKIGKLENEQSHDVYEKWQSDAKNWKKIRDTYDDWEEAGDSPIKFYERSIERIKEMYDGGFIDWQEYRDDTMDAELNLYKAKTDALDELLSDRRDYIKNMKAQFDSEEKSLSEKWEVEDRNASKADISRQLEIFEGAVTQRGIDKYKSLQEEMKKIRREEEMYRLQKSHSETIARLEDDYAEIEANKKYLLASIEQSGLSIEDIVNSVNSDMKSMENTVETLLKQAISAIKSIRVNSSSYSDNRNISISAGSDDIVDALKNRVGISIARGIYH